MIIAKIDDETSAFARIDYLLFSLKHKFKQNTRMRFITTINNHFFAIIGSFAGSYKTHGYVDIIRNIITG